jgi:zinc/manganese transport system permease protein
MTAAGSPALSWNLLDDFREMWSFPFMVNAFRAGTLVALTAGVIGWFVVSRKQSFDAHTLAMVSFPGAAGAVLVGVSAAYGYFAFCIGAALVLAALPWALAGESEGQSAATGTVQASLLACGFLFVALYHGLLTGLNALLFGTFLGVTSEQVVILAAVSLVVLVTMAAVGRPLIFASVDPAVAVARGVPVHALTVLFLVLLGAATAEASQITGVLLVFALLVMPAAAAQQVTARPSLAIALSVTIALTVTWAGLTMAFYVTYPSGFFITTLAFGCYVVARGSQALRGTRRSPLTGRLLGALR